ncbi:MATE family efflux transporter [Marinomonas balearica]|uniref:Putative MATE family efflux protein n=1 Tax=Marinomonas balearica TaxID=491947 RepID=A0A4R6M5F8_9GAMM|nr:MATE family efflux transporter [Marinomonas balearica]TDO96306.1 putative MATE family efflux protein [Marinomonas balearica]
MPKQATFTQGSTLKHIVTMSFTGALGLMIMFLVDLVDMLFLSMLDEKEAVAAVGFASTIMFFTISICIAVSIAAAAMVSRAIGSGDIELAKRRAVNVLAYGIVFSTVLVYLVWPKIPHILLYIGAYGRTLDLATDYLQIVMLGLPAVMIGMIGSGIMRALGDARRAMYATLVGGIVNAVLDPILIFLFRLDVQGAALASLIARFSMVAVSYYGVVQIHKMLGEFDLMDFIKDIRPISFIALPAMLTNICSPLANVIVMEYASSYGDDVVAAVAIVGRVIPVVFGGLFALTGAVGPILGQNYGARRFDRMHNTISSAVTYSFSYTAIVCLCLFWSKEWLISAFSASNETAEMIRFFATYVSFSFLFQSLMFIAIAAFNSLGRPFSGTALNFCRATLGTWPLISFFTLFMDEKGVWMGQAVGSVIFGCIALVMVRRYINELESNAANEIALKESLPYEDVA